LRQRDHAGVLFPPPLIFVLPLVAAAVADSQWPWPLVATPGALLTMAGALFIVAAGMLATSALLVFRQARTTVLPALRPTTTIVERGPYRFSRNPMYLSMVLAYVGVSIIMNSIYAMAALPVLISVIHFFVIRREERYLSAKFGQSYDAYRARVRRWI
jgi:protein-S-isoprenylcysteine O-methyltransferase Ste14